MRPVNLIPLEQRHGGTSVRTGPIAYLLVGALAIALGAVTMVVLANNKIGDRQATIAQLKQQEAAASSQADQFQPFIQFSDSERQRTDTIRTLANSRFDWERVMRELSLVLPNDVSLTNLTATAPSAASADASSTATGAPSVPSLELTGCAGGHEGVAGFLAALRDIDGVTSVDLHISDQSSLDSSSDSSSTGADCRTSSSIAQFEVTVAFGAAPAAQGSAATPTSATPTSATPTSATPTSATPTSATPAGTGG